MISYCRCYMLLYIYIYVIAIISIKWHRQRASYYDFLHRSLPGPRILGAPLFQEISPLTDTSLIRVRANNRKISVEKLTETGHRREHGGVPLMEAGYVTGGRLQSIRVKRAVPREPMMQSLGGCLGGVWCRSRREEHTSITIIVIIIIILLVLLSL